MEVYIVFTLTNSNVSIIDIYQTDEIIRVLCYDFATCKLFVLSVFSSRQGASDKSRSLVIKDVLLISFLKV